jgi:hypothetical protein
MTKTKKFKDMKTRNLSTLLTSALVSIAALSSCQQTLELDMPTDVTRTSNIRFSNYVSHMTRGSKTNAAGSFVKGDTMAVWGKQTTSIGEYNFVDFVFNNQPVEYVDANTWTYSPEKAWNFTSTYMFYGVFPYSQTLYTMSSDTNFCVTIPTYTTPDLPDDQKDLMISEQRYIIPDNTVDMVFHHILSNVNVIAKIGSAVDTSKIQSVTLKQIKFYNVQSTGKYTQTGWDSVNCAVGAWSDVNGYMNIPTVTDKVLTKDADTIYKDYLMIPQNLFGSGASPKDASIDAVFRIVYKDGTSSTHVKTGLRLAGITGTRDTVQTVINSWKPNYRYNYTLAFNPQKAARTWDADGDGSLQIDPTTGDTIKGNDTPTGGTMKYSPDDPNTIYVLEDTDGDSIPDTWNRYPVVWEDVDGDGFLEAGIDRNNDGHIDNVDGENETQQGGNTTHDPSDGNAKNPDGKDVILVHYDSNHDGKIDDNDEWRQVEKDPTTGNIVPVKEEEDRTIQFTATVSEWEQTYSLPVLTE